MESKLSPGSEFRYQGHSRSGFVGIVRTFPEKNKNKKLYSYLVEVVHPVPLDVMLTQEGPRLPEKGERISFFTTLKTARNGGNEFEFDYESYLHVRGVEAVAFLPEKDAWKSMQAPSRFQSGLNQFRRQMLEASYDYLEVEMADFLRSLVFGDKLNFDYDLVESFRRVGILHALVVSGFHLVLTSIWIFFCLTAIASIFPWIYRYIGPHHMKGCSLLISAAFFYFFTNSSIPSERAIISFLIVACLLGIRRKTHALWMCFSVFFMSLMLQPLLLFDLSFQLTFSAIFGLLIWTEYKSLESADESVFWQRWTLDHLCMSLVATICTLPVLMMAFRHVNIFSILGNVAFSPWYGVVLLPVGLMACLTHFIHQEFSVFLFCCFEVVAEFLHTSLLICGRWFSMGEVGRVASLFYVLILLAPICSFFKWTRRARILYFSSFLFCSLLLAFYTYFPSEEKSRISFLYVGQGDSTIIRTKSGKTILVDAGPGGPYKSNAGERVLLPWLKAHRIEKLEAMIITHGDWDHIGGAQIILEQMPVEQLWLSRLDHSESSEVLERLAIRLGVEVLRVDTHQPVLRDDNFALKVMHPFADDISAKTDNAASVALEVKMHGFTTLLMGDLEAEGEKKMLERSRWIRADLLKVGHHGSRTSSTEDFLRQVQPKWAIISSGWQNIFNHPSRKVLDRLLGHGVRIFRTDLSGELGLHISSDEIILESFGKI